MLLSTFSSHGMQQMKNIIQAKYNKERHVSKQKLKLLLGKMKIFKTSFNCTKNALSHDAFNKNVVFPLFLANFSDCTHFCTWWSKTAFLQNLSHKMDFFFFFMVLEKILCIFLFFNYFLSICHSKFVTAFSIY